MERSVRVRLEAQVSGFTAGMAQAKRSVDDVKNAALDAAAKNKKGLNDVARGAAAVGLTAAAGLGLAVKRFADFDKAMSAVKAATRESTGNMKLLREAALQAGKDTAFSASEAAAGIESLAKAGISTSAILGGGLKGALDLAAAGQIDVGMAAEVAATAMTQFKLAGKDVPHVADLLAAGAGKAQGEVTDMAAALKQSGLVASQFGLNVEETTGTLAAFASAGLLGSDAGTSFKTMLLSLANPSKEAAATMADLGINVHDAQGQFIGIAPLAEQLKSRLSGVSQETRNAALATIFGTDAIRAAAILYDQGGKGIADWTTKVNDQGFAAEQAAAKTDNLSGDIERLGGALDTALIKGGSGANSVLRGLAQGADTVVTGFSEMPSAVTTGVTALAGVTAVAGLTTGGLLKVASAAGDMRETWQGLSRGSKGFALSLGGVGVALTAAAVIYGVFANRNAEAEQKVTDLRDTLDEQTGAITGNTRAYVANELAQSGLAEKAKGLGLDLATVTDSALGNKDALESVVASLDAVIRSGTRSGVVMQGHKTVMTADAQAAARLKTDLLGTSGALTDAQKRQKLATEGAQGHATAQQTAQAAIKKANEAVRAETQSLNELIEAMHRASGVALTLSGAQISYQAALDDATESIKDNGRTLDINSEKGRANRTALDSLAKSANDQSDAMLESGRSLTEVAAKAESTRKNFITVATQMGLNRKEAEALAKQLIDIPTTANTDITNTAAAAKAKVVDYQKTGLENLPATVSTGVRLTGVAAASQQVGTYRTHGLGSIPATVPTAVTVKGVSAASAAVSEFATHVDKTLGEIADEAITIRPVFDKSSMMPSEFARKKAMGGPIRGSGTGTSDTAGLFALSNREWVIRAASATRYGDRAMKSVNDGTAIIIPGLAAGGRADVNLDPALPSPAAQAAFAAGIAATTRAIAQSFAAPLAKLLGVNPGLAATLEWARTQVGKPYVWGAVGPGGYDCSGMVSAAINRAQGKNPHQRLGATGSMPWSMFAPGAGPFMVGWFQGNPGHTAATINGVNIESRGGQGVVMGSSARGADDSLFTSRMHVDGFAKGGIVGDPPFDLLDPRGKHFGKLPPAATIKPGAGRGLVQWAEGETGGEAFIPLAPSKRDRSAKILATVADQFGMMLVQRFADGGIRPGRPLLDLQFLLQELTKRFNPLEGIDLAGAIRDMRVARAREVNAFAGLRAAHGISFRATRAEGLAERSLTTQEHRVDTARERFDKSHDIKDPKKRAAEETAALANLRLEVERLRARYALLQQAKKNNAAASLNLKKAEDAYSTAVDKAKIAADAHREALEKLQAQQEAAVQLAKSVAQQQLQGTGIVELFGGSLTAGGLLADLQAKGAQTKAFGGQLAQLRKAGLSEALLTQIQDAGADAGSEIAAAILAAGGGYVKQLNAAQGQLDAQANAIGAAAANAVYSAVVPTLKPLTKPQIGARAGGGPVEPFGLYRVGETGTELLQMGSQPGWVHPSGAINANRFTTAPRFAGSWGAGAPGVSRPVEFTQINHGVQDADILARRAVAQLTFAGSGIG